MLRSLLFTSVVVLLAGCGFPNKNYSTLPDPGIIRVTQTEAGFQAIPPECARLLEPSRLNKFDDPRPAVAFGCATYTNLAEQLARPRDLTHPAPYAGQSPDTAGAAVQRYRENAVTPLRSTSATDIGVSN